MDQPHTAYGSIAGAGSSSEESPSAYLHDTRAQRFSADVSTGGRRGWLRPLSGVGIVSVACLMVVGGGAAWRSSSHRLMATDTAAEAEQLAEFPGDIELSQSAEQVAMATAIT